MNVAQFATELGLPVELLLEQLQAAGVAKKQEIDPVSEQDKATLLEHLRSSHGSNTGKITLTRRETTSIKKTDSSGKARTIQVEVRKKRVVAPAVVETSTTQVQPAAVEDGAPLKEIKTSKEAIAPVKHKRHLQVEHYLSKVEKLLPEHPNESLNNMRKAVEAICKDILDETYENKDEGKALRPASTLKYLEDMTLELKRRKQLPVAIEKYLAVLQHYGNFGSHDQETDKDDVSSEISATIMANSSLLPLKALVDWYKAF